MNSSVHILHQAYCFQFQVKGRIVHVNPTVKTVGMTLLEDIVEFTEEESIEDTIGQLDTCTVIRADSNKGLLIELSDGRKGYVHVSMLLTALTIVLTLTNVVFPFNSV